MAKVTDYRPYITIVPEGEYRHGKPVIRGTNIGVHDVLSWLAAGKTFEDILSENEGLTREDIQACFAFAAEPTRRIYTSPP